MEYTLFHVALACLLTKRCPETYGFRLLDILVDVKVVLYGSCISCDFDIIIQQGISCIGQLTMPRSLVGMSTDVTG